MKTFWAVLLLSSLSFITTYLGFKLAWRFRSDNKVMASGLGFSVGMMLWISIFELLPPVIADLGLGRTLIWLGAGCLLIFLLDFILPHTHLCHERGKINLNLKVAYLVGVGLILHDFPEGFALASSYIHSSNLGILVALSIALHNLPEEWAMSVPLVVLGKKKVLYRMAFVSALAEPVGAIIGLLIVSIFFKFNSFLMAFTAGAMIFISLHELVPQAKSYKKPALFFLGLILSALVLWAMNFLIRV